MKRPFFLSRREPYRNAIFHSNYAIFGDNIRLLAAHRTFPVAKIIARANRAIAAFEALVHVENYHRLQYTKPRIIQAPQYFAHETGTTATVIVREGFGPVGIHSTVTDFGNQVQPVIVGRMTNEELRMVRQGRLHLPRS